MQIWVGGGGGVWALVLNSSHMQMWSSWSKLLACEHKSFRGDNLATFWWSTDLQMNAKIDILVGAWLCMSGNQIKRNTGKEWSTSSTPTKTPAIMSEVPRRWSRRLAMLLNQAGKNIEQAQVNSLRTWLNDITACLLKEYWCSTTARTLWVWGSQGYGARIESD